MRILLVGADAAAATSIIEACRRETLEVAIAEDGHEGLRMATGHRYDLVVLPLQMRRMRGIEVLGHLRKVSSVPVMVLAPGASETDSIVALEMGADDVERQPLSERELVARMKALIRRYRSTPQETSAISAAGVELYPTLRLARLDGQPVPLTTLEFDVLEVLLRRAGTVVTRDDLAARLFNRNAQRQERSFDMHISSLRRKLGAERIKTVRGIGYLFVGDGGPPETPSRVQA